MFIFLIFCPDSIRNLFLLANTTGIQGTPPLEMVTTCSPHMTCSLFEVHTCSHALDGAPGVAKGQPKDHSAQTDLLKEKAVEVFHL